MTRGGRRNDREPSIRRPQRCVGSAYRLAIERPSIMENGTHEQVSSGHLDLAGSNGRTLGNHRGLLLWSRLGPWLRRLRSISPLARQLRIGVCFAFGLFMGLAVAFPYGERHPYIAWDVSTVYHVEGCPYGPQVEHLTAAQVKRMAPCPHCIQLASQKPRATTAMASSKPIRK